LPRLKAATATAAAFVAMGLVTVGWSAAAAADPTDTPTPTCEKPVETTVAYPHPEPDCRPDDHHGAGEKYGLDAVCKPDKHQVVLKIVNRTDEDADFTLKRLYGDEEVTGTVAADDRTFVTVSWTAPDDTWVLKVGKKRLKERVGQPKDCRKPSHSPSHSPSPSPSPSGSPSHSARPSVSVSPTEPPLPTTGSPVSTLVTAGAGLIGAGALALLLARRRRAAE
jgi:LPXTG-motif cell wall-anchored protein